MRIHAAVMLVAATSALCYGSTAYAQADSPSQEGAEADDSGLAEIIVTAQRRSESVQKSSLSISVVSASELVRQGIGSTQDLSRTMPGVQIGVAGPTPQIYVRGVGDPGTTAITNPAVALNVGGVYYARPGAAGGAFYDLDRVEVLKGPQGTLYGRNASGGAINILPTRPVLGKVQAKVDLEAGNYDLIGSEGAVNLPVGDMVALRGAYQIRQRDGYLSDGSSDDVRQAVRVQALIEPSEAVSLLLFGSYFHQGGVGNGYALYDPAGNPASTPPRPATALFDPWTSTTDARAAAILATGAPPPVFRPGSASLLYQDNRFWNLQAELTADLGFATLTVIPSYQHVTQDYEIYPTLHYHTRDGAGAGKPETSKAYSGEVRLSNDSDRLNWVLGVFYYNEDQRARSTINNGLAQNVSLSTAIKTESAAAFGQATLTVADGIRVIAGLRYTTDKRSMDGTRTNNLAPPTVGVRPLTDSTKTDRVNYKGGFEFDVSPRNMVYATVATGFKGGGLSPAVVSPFKPEQITAFTLGSRNRFLDNRLQFNIEGFYWKYKDQQLQVIGPDDIGIIAAIIRNAGRGKSYGVEADLQFKLTDNDTFFANTTYNKTKYDDFVYTTPFAFIPAGQTGCAVAPTGMIGPVGPVASVNCSGKPLIRAPQWAGSVGYSHRFDLGQSGDITFNGDMQFASGREATSDYIANTHVPAYQVYNASLTWANASDNLTFTGYIRNIGNEAVYLGGIESNFVPSFVALSIGAPRTYGLKLSYRY